MVPDCEKNAGDELCMDATCFVHKAFLPAIHPAEPCNYGQSLVHHSNCGCCCPILNPLILSVKPISEISNGLCSLLPRAEVHLSFLWVSPRFIIAWNEAFFWFAGDVTARGQMHTRDYKEGKGVQGMWSPCFSNHLSCAQLPSYPGHFLASSILEREPTVWFPSLCVSKMVGFWNRVPYWTELPLSL